MLPKRTYNISFGIEKTPIEDNPNKSEIPLNNVQIVRQFEFHDYDSISTIGHLKEYFLTNFAQRSKYCKCTLLVYYKASNIYYILSKNENEKLSNYKYDTLYLVKINLECNCQLKSYTKYMNMHS